MGCLEFSLGIETVQNARLWETFGAWNRYIRRRCEFLLRGNIDLPPSEIYNISARYVVTLCRISRIELNILCHIHFFFFRSYTNFNFQPWRVIPFSRIDRNMARLLYKGNVIEIVNFLSRDPSYDEINSFDNSIRRERFFSKFYF